MRHSRTLVALAIGGSLITLAGCETGPPMPRLPPPGAIAPTVPAYAYGEVISGRAARLKKARAAKLRPIAAASVMDFVTRAEVELRRQTAGTGVDVIRSGELLLLRLPATGTFDVGRSEVRPQAVSTLTEIALTLKRFNQSYVDVLGHTDATGTAEANRALSQRRAEAVAKQLSSRGVASARIATRGYGAAYPIAENVTETGRGINRRVEIKIVPIR